MRGFVACFCKSGYKLGPKKQKRGRITCRLERRTSRSFASAHAVDFGTNEQLSITVTTMLEVHFLDEAEERDALFVIMCILVEIAEERTGPKDTSKRYTELLSDITNNTQCRCGITTCYLIFTSKDCSSGGRRQSRNSALLMGDHQVHDGVLSRFIGRFHCSRPSAKACIFYPHYPQLFSFETGTDDDRRHSRHHVLNVCPKSSENER
jgi:hypothetical protein